MDRGERLPNLSARGRTMVSAVVRMVVLHRRACHRRITGQPQLVVRRTLPTAFAPGVHPPAVLNSIGDVSHLDKGTTWEYISSSVVRHYHTGDQARHFGGLAAFATDFPLHPTLILSSTESLHQRYRIESQYHIQVRRCLGKHVHWLQHELRSLLGDLP